MLVNIDVQSAAKIMDKDPMFVYCGLRAGLLPFGTAVNKTGRRYSYHISAGKFAEYLGITLPQLEQELKAL